MADFKWSQSQNAKWRKKVTDQKKKIAQYEAEGKSTERLKVYPDYPTYVSRSADRTIDAYVRYHKALRDQGLEGVPEVSGAGYIPGNHYSSRKMDELKVSRDLVNQVAKSADNHTAEVTRWLARKDAFNNFGAYMKQPIQAGNSPAGTVNASDLKRQFYTENKYLQDYIKEVRSGQAAQYINKADMPEETGLDVKILGKDAHIQAPRAVTMLTNPALDKARQYQTQYMSEDEKNRYRYIVGKNGQKAGTEYLESISSRLNRREAEDLEGKFRSAAEKNPILGTGINVGYGMVGGVAGTAATARNAIGDRKLDQYDRALNAARYQQAAQQGVQRGNRNALQKLTGADFTSDDSALGRASDFGTGVVLSSLNSIASATLMPEAAVLANFSGNAAGSAMLDASQDINKSKNQATATAVAQGIAESLFEKWSVENFNAMKAKPVTSAKVLAKNLLKTMIGEGSEEFFTDAANDMTDYMINGDNSAFMKDFNARLQNGEDEDHARMGALKDRFLSASQSFLAGALSGAASTGAASAISTYGNGRTMQSLAKEYAESRSNLSAANVNNNPQGMAGMYQEIADSVDDSTEEGRTAKSVAQAAADRLNQGKTLSGMQQGYVGNAVDAAVEASMQNTQNQDTQVEPETESTKNQTAETRAFDDIPYNVYNPDSRADIRKDLEAAQRRKYEAASPAMQDQMRALWNKQAEVLANSGLYGEAGSKAIKDVTNETLTTGQISGDTIRAAREAYNYGRYGSSMEDSRTPYTALLLPEQFEKMFKAGVEDAKTSNKEILNVAYKTRIEERIGGVEDNQVKSYASKDLVNVLDKLGQKTGLVFRLHDSANGVGLTSEARGSYQNGVIDVDINNPNILATVSHEMTHWIREYDPEGYVPFRDAAVQAILKSRNTDLDSMVSLYQEEYQKAGQKLSREEAVEEIVANSTENFLNDEDFIKEITTEHKSIASRIVEWLTDVVDAIKNLISTRAYHAGTKALMEDLKQYEHARDLWVKAADEALDRMKTSEVSRISTKMQRIINDYQNSTDASLKEYVEEVINGSETQNNITVLDEIPDSLASEINRIIGINPIRYRAEIRKQEIWHIWKRHGAKGMADHSMQDINDLARIGYVIDNYDNVKLGLKDSKAFRNSDGTRAKTVEITKIIGDKIYHVIEAVPVSRRNTANTISAYIENIKIEAADRAANATKDPDLDVQNEVYPATSTANISLSDNAGNSRNNDTFDRKFQLRDDAQMDYDGTVSHKSKKKLSGKGLAEQTGTLIAVHNIDATKLGSLLGYDSIPMPSIAITKADMGWNDFGDISFIFRKNTIDPAADKRNRVYGADAWTPTFPTIENDVDENVKYRAYDIVKKTMNGTEPSYLEEEAKNFISIRSADIAESSGMDELIKRASEDYGMKAAYLASKGITVHDHTEEVKESNISDSKISLYQDMVQAFGEDLKGAHNIPAKEVIARFGDKIQKVYHDNLIKNGVDESFAAKRSNALLKSGNDFGKYPGWRAVQTFVGASDYMDKGVQYTTRTVRDEDAVHKEIDSHIDAAGLNKWLDGLFSGMVKGTGIYNGRDYFTPSGNRRSFAQTHYSVTPENIVRAMVSEQQGEGKSAAVAPGIKGIIAAGSKEYHSVEDIHKDESRIQNLTKEEMNEAVHGLDQRLEVLERKIQDQSSYKSYSSIDTIHEAIVEVSEKKRVTDATIQKAFDYYGWIKATPEDITEIRDIIQEARKVPVDMFEAKPERTVDYSEVAHVLVPNTLSPEYRERLAARGLDIIEYDPEIDGDRLEKMRSLDDIRFQLDIDDESVPDDLSAVNDRMKDASEAVVNLIMESKNARPSDASISKLANRLIKEYHSTVQPELIRDQITRLYTTMSLTGEEHGIDVVKAAMAIGGEIIDNATMVDEVEEAKWDSLKKTLRNTTIYVSPQNVHDISPEGFEKLRRRYFGKIRFTEDPQYANFTGSEAYKQLSQMYPDYFTENADQIYDLDAIEEIMNVRDSGGPLVQNAAPESAADFDEASMMLSDDILDLYFSAAGKSQKDQYRESYHKAVQAMQKDIHFELAKYKQKLEVENERKLSLLKKQYAENMLTSKEYLNEKAKLDEALKKTNLEREAVRERFKQHKEDYIKKQKKANEIKRIESSMKKIQRMIEQPTNRQHVPAPLVKGIQQLFSVIDLTTDTSSRANILRQTDFQRLQNMNFENVLQDFKNVVRAVKDNDGALVDPETHLTTYITLDPDFLTRLELIESNIESMAKNFQGVPKVRKMSYEQVHELAETMSYIRHSLDYANRFTAIDQNGTIGTFAEKTFADLRKRKAGMPYDEKTAPTRNFLFKMLEEGMLDSPTFFNLIGPSGDKVYDTLRKGLDKKTVSIDHSMQYIENMMSQIGVSPKELRMWDMKPREIEIHGEKVKVTDAQLMELYVLNHREQARKHIYGNKENMETQRVNGGIQFLGASVRGKKDKLQTPIRYVTETDIAKAIDLLSPRQKQVAQSMQQFLSGYMSQLGNETSMNLYGYEKFTEPDYWPIHTMSNFRATKTTDIENNMTTLENMGWTKSTVMNAQNPLEVGSIFDTFVDHVDKMSSYNAYLPGLTDLRKWLNYQDAYTSMKSELASHMGENSLEYINHLIQDLNGSRGRADSWGIFSESLVGKAKGVAVAANPSVWIQQPFSIVRASAEMNPKYILQALEPTQIAKRKEEWKNCQDYAPIAKWKEFGGADIGTGRSIKQLLFGNKNKIEDFTEWSMKPAEAGDRLTWCTLWMAAENQVRAEQKDLKAGSPEFYKAAADVFNHVIDFTQVVDSPLHRTEMMKSKNPLAQLATAFQSEPQKTYDMLYREVYKARQGDKKARKRIGSVLAILLCNIIATNAGKALMQALKDKDKDKKYGERWKDALLDDIGVGGIVEALDPDSDASILSRIGTAVNGYILSDTSLFSYVPYVKDMIETFQNNLTSSGYGDSDLSNQTLTDLITGVKALISAPSGNSTKGIMGTIYAASSAGHFLGLPLKNMMKYVGASIDEMLNDINTDTTRRLWYTRNQLMLNEGNESNTQTFVKEALKAYVEGDTELGDKIMADLKEKGIDDDKINSKLTSLLKKELEFDSAVEAKAAGNDEEYESARSSLIAKGYAEDFVNEKIDSGVQSEIRKNAPYTGAEIAEILYNKTDGYQDSLQAYANYQKQYYGKTDKEIRSSIKSSMTSKYKPQYLAADSETRIQMDKKLFSIRYNKEQLYTKKDLDNWLK